MNRNLFTTTICTLVGAMIASADVPSLINYQGRLTDSGGAPVTGSKNFTISIYDAATGGNLLYSETIGAVTLDANGVYSFQFGGAGTSNTQVTETIGTTVGSTLTYTKTLSNTPVVANSITVTDGTNSWSQSVGNPGVAATATATTISGFVIGGTITNAGSGYTSAPAVTITGNGSGASATATISGGTVTGITITSAGSGYTGGATITIAPPVIPFRVDYIGGAITATYSSAPAAGRTITATYRYGTSGIADALASGPQQWLELTVDGVAQSPRQKVLAVPFAMNAAKASVASSLEKVVKTCQLVVLTPTSPNTTTNGSSNGITYNTLRRTLPASVSPNSIGQATNDSFFQKIGNQISVIHSISSEAVISTTDTLYSLPSATIELASYSKNGTRTVVATQTKNSNGPFSVSGPLILDHSQYEYVLECSIGTGTKNSANQTSNTTTMKPIEIKYE